MLQVIRAWTLLATLVPPLALACTAHGDPDGPVTTPPEQQPAPTPAPTGPEPPQPVVTTPTPAPLALGWSSDLREQPKAARKHNSDALKLHRKGDYTGSLAGFDAAIALAPDMAIAHFNRACALSRLGRTADAAAVMRRLLAIDLLAFGPRLDADADLAALRASPEAASLATLRGELVTRYAAAVTRGIPTQFNEKTWGSDQLPNYYKFRAGVWLTDTNTFVPVTPEIDDSFSIVWSAATATVLVLHGPMTSMTWQVIPAEFTVDIYDLAHPGTRLRSHPAVIASFAKLFPKVPQDDEGWPLSFQRLGVHPLPDRTQLAAFDHYTGKKSRRVEFGGPEPIVVKQPPATGWRHDVHPREGVIVDGLPDGYTRNKSALTVPGRAAPIALGELFKWTQVVTTPDNSAAFVLTQDIGCEKLRHRLLRLDLKSHELRELSTGAAAGTITPAQDGSLYLQLGETTRLLAPDGALTDVALPPWLHVTRPLINQDCYL